MRRNLVQLVCFTMLAVLPLAVLAQEFPSAQPSLDFIADHPEDAAVLCYTSNADAPEFTLNADEPFPLASTYKLVILAEMARQMDAGLIDPAEEVPLEAVNAYWLPGTDGNAHQTWLDTLAPGQEMVTLGEVTYAMMSVSSNASADYLLVRLGIEGFPELFRQLGLENTDLPIGGFLGLFLAHDNHETGKANIETLDVETLAAERERLENLYLTDKAWREAEQAYVTEKATSLTTNPDSIAAEIDRQWRFFEAFGMKGSTRDMLKIMEAAYGETTFSEEARRFMQSKLNWIMDLNPVNREVYDDLGNKGGTWPSILTGVWYVTPKDGESIALAVFYRNLPLELWGEWVTTYAQQGLELRAVAGGEGCGVFDGL